jgi:hypothetical protein
MSRLCGPELRFVNPAESSPHSDSQPKSVMLRSGRISGGVGPERPYDCAADLPDHPHGQQAAGRDQGGGGQFQAAAVLASGQVVEAKEPGSGT